MRLSLWLGTVPSLAITFIPVSTHAASCDASLSAASVIGREFVATAGPSSDGKYRYESIDLHCTPQGTVTWYTWNYRIDFGWHHPDSVAMTLPPAGFATDHRLFVNACGTRLVGVNKRYGGEISGIDMSLSSYPLQDEVYLDRFEQPIYIEYGTGIERCAVPTRPQGHELGRKGDCTQPMIADHVNAASGNNFYHERDISDTDLNFERVYNSQSDFEGVLGPDWQHNYEQTLQVDNDAITAQRPDGQVATFDQISDGHWRSRQQPGATIARLDDGSGAYRYSDRNGNRSTFDATGRWQSTTRRGGSTVRGVYDNERLSRIVDGYGNAIALEYNSSGRLTRVTAPGQRTHSYRYRDDGMLAAAERADGSGRNYQYDARPEPALTGVSDQYANPLNSWIYDEKRRVTALFKGSDSGTAETNADNHRLSYHDGSTEVTNPLGKRTNYYFDRFDNGRRVVELDGEASASCPATNSSFAYSPSGLLQTRTDRNGNLTRYGYNVRGLPNQRIEAVGQAAEREVTTLWHPTLNAPEQITGALRQTDFSYDDSGRVLSRTVLDRSEHQSGSRSWRYSYNADGRLLEVDGPRTDVDDSWGFAYDARGKLSEITNPLGHRLSVTETNAAGEPTTIVDSNGIALSLSYDPLGRLVSATSGGLQSNYAYSDSGQLTRAKLPGLGAIEYDYDSADRLTGITNARGERIQYTLDQAGNRVDRAITDAHGSVVAEASSDFDALSRLRQQLSASGQTVSSYDYDARGNETAIVEPLGARITRIYDALDRIAQVTQRDRGVITYRYDSLDQLQSVTDPRGLRTEYHYDGLGNLLQINSPDSGVTRFAFDSGGNMIQRVDARGTISNYTYDALNRLLQVSYPTDSWLDVALHYDSTAEENPGIGRLTRIDDATGSTDLRYDALGRVIHKSVAIGKQHYQWAYSYHPSGQLASATSPSAYQVLYHYDGSGLLAAVTARESDAAEEQTLLDQVSWHPFGKVRSWRYGNGIEAQFTRDLDYRLQQLSVAGSDPLVDRTYAYNALQDITGIADNLYPEASQQLAYDPEHRLLSASGLYGSLSYRYDEVGNRLGHTQDDANGRAEAIYHYSTNSNHLQRIEHDAQGQRSEVQLQYDVNGNLIARDGQTFAYNDANRMTHADSGHHSQTNAFNALGQRVMVDSGSRRTHYHYDLQGRLIAESDGNTGQILREYVYAAGQVVAVFDHPPPKTETPEIEPIPDSEETPTSEPPAVSDRGEFSALAAWFVSQVQDFSRADRAERRPQDRRRVERFFERTSAFFERARGRRCVRENCKPATNDRRQSNRQRRQ